MTLSNAQKILILVLALLVIAGLLAWAATTHQWPFRTKAQPDANQTPGGTNAGVNLSNLVRTPDADGDGLADADEGSAKTNPNARDTDNDSLDDFLEVKVYRTNPLAADSDGDGAADGAEVAEKTNPNGSGPLLDTAKAIDQLTNTAP